MLCGIDPHHHLTSTDPLEMVVIARATARRNELRQQELDYLARQIVRELAHALRSR